MKARPDLPQLDIARRMQAFRQGKSVTATELQGFDAGVPPGPRWFRLGGGPTTGLAGWAPDSIERDAQHFGKSRCMGPLGTTAQHANGQPQHRLPRSLPQRFARRLSTKMKAVAKVLDPDHERLHL